jgi:hypothetical protein
MRGWILFAFLFFIDSAAAMLRKMDGDQMRETDWTQEFLILLNRDHEAIFREWWQTETLSFLYPFLSQHIIGDGGVGSNGHRQGLHRRTMAG